MLRPGQRVRVDPRSTGYVCVPQAERGQEVSGVRAGVVERQINHFWVRVQVGERIIRFDTCAVE